MVKSLYSQLYYIRLGLEKRSILKKRRQMMCNENATYWISFPFNGNIKHLSSLQKVNRIKISQQSSQCGSWLNLTNSALSLDCCYGRVRRRRGRKPSKNTANIMPKHSPLPFTALILSNCTKHTIRMWYQSVSITENIGTATSPLIGFLFKKNLDAALGRTPSPSKLKLCIINNACSTVLSKLYAVLFK